MSFTASQADPAPQGARPQIPAGHGLALALLALLLAVLAALSNLTLLHVRDAAIVANNQHLPFGLRGALHAIRLQDAGLALAAGLSLLAVILAELRGRRFSALLHSARPAHALLLLTILTAFTGHGFLAPGVLLGGDIATHISRFHEVATGLAQGVLPHWTNFQYTGEPLLWFTGPLPFVVGGTLAWVVGDANLAAKLILFAGHMAAGWLFYAWMRRLGVSAMAAALAAAFFAGCFAQLHLYFYCGVLPQVFTIAFMLLCLISADGIMRGTGRPAGDVLLFGLSTGLLIINHQPHAPFVAFYLGLYGLAMLAAGQWQWRHAPLLAASGVLGAAISAVAVVTVLADPGTMIAPANGLFQLRWPTPSRLLSLITWANTRSAWRIVDYWTYLGLGLIVFGAAGATLGLSRLAPPRRPIARVMTLSLAIGLCLYNPVVRDIMFLMLFAAVLAALALEHGLTRQSPPTTALRAVVLLTLIDLLATAIQPVARSDKDFHINAGRWLETHAAGSRVAEIHLARDGKTEADMGPDGSLLSYRANIQRLAGNHNMAATLDHNFLVVTAKSLEGDVLRGGVSPRTRAALGLFNVTRIICSAPDRLGCPATMGPNDTHPVFGPNITLPASPVLFSRTLRQQQSAPGAALPALWPRNFWPEENHTAIRTAQAELTRALGVLRPDFATATAAALESTDGPAQTLPADPSWQASLKSYSVSLQHVQLNVRSTAPCFLQLAHPAFPGQQLRMDGQPITAWHSPLNLLVLPLPAGEHVIDLTPGLTRAQTTSIWISSAALMLLLLLSAALTRAGNTLR